MSKQPWLNNYPEGVSPEINPDVFNRAVCRIIR